MQIDYSKLYRFELNLGYKCNFRCSYCFEPLSPIGFSNADVTSEQLHRFADYMKYVAERLGSGVFHSICVYGGEPFLYFDRLVPFLLELKGTIHIFSLTTNGSMIKARLPELLQLQQALGGGLHINVSYDFTHQDKTRQAGTYQSVRDSVLLLDAHGFHVTCNTVLDRYTLPRIDETVRDFFALRQQCSNLVTKCQLARNRGDLDGVDVLQVRRALSRVASYFAQRPELRRSFFINPSLTYRGATLPYALTNNILLAMTPGGELYPGYDLPYMSDVARRYTLIGNIADDFDQIERNRLAMVEKLHLETPERCRTCDALCRFLPWMRMGDDIAEWGALPEQIYCDMYRLLTKYISYRP